MKFKSRIYLLAITLTAVLVVPACKAKKPLVQPPAPAAAPEPAPTQPAPVEQKKVEPEASTPAPMVVKPDYNFKNIQFEFNSAVLKTSAYLILDKAVVEMKKDASVKFALGGYASAEGTPEHNMSLSVERANAVKTYLVNGGINGDNLTASGYGEANPVAGNTDEASRALNRRVEIKKR